MLTKIIIVAACELVNILFVAIAVVVAVAIAIAIATVATSAILEVTI